MPQAAGFFCGRVGYIGNAGPRRRSERRAQTVLFSMGVRSTNGRLLQKETKTFCRDHVTSRNAPAVTAAVGNGERVRVEQLPGRRQTAPNGGHGLKFSGKLYYLGTFTHKERAAMRRSSACSTLR